MGSPANSGQFRLLPVVDRHGVDGLPQRIRALGGDGVSLPIAGRDRGPFRVRAEDEGERKPLYFSQRLAEHDLDPDRFPDDRFDLGQEREGPVEPVKAQVPSLLETHEVHSPEPVQFTLSGSCRRLHLPSDLAEIELLLLVIDEK